MLVEARAELNHMSEAGATPLCVAKEYRSENALKVLLDAKADARLNNNNNNNNS